MRYRFSCPAFRLKLHKTEKTVIRLIILEIEFLCDLIDVLVLEIVVYETFPACVSCPDQSPCHGIVLIYKCLVVKEPCRNIAGFYVALAVELNPAVIVKSRDTYLCRVEFGHEYCRKVKLYRREPYRTSVIVMREDCIAISEIRIVQPVFY